MQLIMWCAAGYEHAFRLLLKAAVINILIMARNWFLVGNRQRISGRRCSSTQLYGALYCLSVHCLQLAAQLYCFTSLLLLWQFHIQLQQAAVFSSQLQKRKEKSCKTILYMTCPVTNKWQTKLETGEHSMEQQTS